MRWTPRVTLPTLALMTVAACQPKPAALSGADLQALHGVTQSFKDHVMAKDWDAVTRLYADSASLLPPNAPAVHGRAAIRGYFAAFPPVTAFTLVDDTIDGVGDLAYGHGHYVLTLGLPGSPVDSGKYLNVLRRQADGSWQYVEDTWNSSAPMPTGK
ncbi:MAG TPA: DUF4440 domain-containing protein [Gemmatimonadales bacterium]|nr:DUF4440 domain-containing protein [Gemmatimonadales bacterium]